MTATAAYLSSGAFGRNRQKYAVGTGRLSPSGDTSLRKTVEVIASWPVRDGYGASCSCVWLLRRIPPMWQMSASSRGATPVLGRGKCLGRAGKCRNLVASCMAQDGHRVSADNRRFGPKSPICSSNASRRRGRRTRNYRPRDVSELSTSSIHMSVSRRSAEQRTSSGGSLALPRMSIK